MNNVIMRKVDITETYQPLVAEQTVISGTLSAPPDNTGVVYFKGDDGSDVPWIPGQWHRFHSVDLAEIEVKGNGETIRWSARIDFTKVAYPAGGNGPN